MYCTYLQGRTVLHLQGIRVSYLEVRGSSLEKPLGLVTTNISLRKSTSSRITTSIRRTKNHILLTKLIFSVIINPLFGKFSSILTEIIPHLPKHKMIPLKA
jgi:hypothetical protein